MVPGVQTDSRPFVVPEDAAHERRKVWKRMERESSRKLRLIEEEWEAAGLFAEWGDEGPEFTGRNAEKAKRQAEYETLWPPVREGRNGEKWVRVPSSRLPGGRMDGASQGELDRQFLAAEVSRLKAELAKLKQEA